MGAFCTFLRVRATVLAHKVAVPQLLSVVVSDAELEVVLACMRAGGWPSPANFLRGTIAGMAIHLDIPVPKGCFDQRFKELPEPAKER